MRDFDEIIQALMEDETWELSPEERQMCLMDLAWTLLDL